MKYRVEIDLAFADEQDAINLMNTIEAIKAKAFKPTGSEKIDIYRKTRYHACSHDDINPTQCTDYTNIDFDKPEAVHVKKGV